jgi:NAD+ kinase
MIRSVTAQIRLDRIGVVVHPRRELDNALTSLRAWAQRCDADVVQLPMPGVDRAVAEPGTAESCDVVVALGGDGTTLAALHAAATAGKPVLGVACGSLGALTTTSADHIEEALRALSAGEWHARRLPGIEVTADGSPLGVAVNDFVVVRKGASQIAVAIEVDGELFVRFAGDGIVIATPLGSSAYTMAAGGPVLAPGTDSIVLTPVAPHGGTCPPLVVGRDSALKVSIEPGYYGARIELDGRTQDLLPPTLSLAWRDDYATLVAFAGAETLLAGLRRRGILRDSPRVLARDGRTAATTPR